MGKKHELPSFNDFLKELKEKSVTNSKPVEEIEEKKYFLIVSEGERTEPLYFNYFKKLLPRHLLDTIDIKGEGDNTINIVKKAIELRAIREKDILLPNYTECWAVYDKDDFPAVRFNQAVELAANENIGSAHSNQSFELWYILHFQYLNTCLHRSDYIPLLSKHLEFKYEKNDTNVVKHLFTKCNIRQAVEWAEMLENEFVGDTPSNSCPSTMVYKLVKSLLSYCKYEDF